MAMIRHPELDITAPAPYWRALAVVTGAYRVQHRDNGEDYLYVDRIGAPRTEILLLQGIEHTQSHDQRVIVWALDELQRRREEDRRVSASAGESDAIQALAKALASERDGAFLERLLPHLTERTRFAVRAQLKKSSFPVTVDDED